MIICFKNTRIILNKISSCVILIQDKTFKLVR